MANKFLENITEEKKDLKKIRNTLEKIYEIEVKEEKREALTQKREEQKRKRSKADTKLKIKDLLGINKTDERKSKKGFLGLISKMLGGILALGAKPLLTMAGIGLVGAGIAAYIKSEPFRNAVNQHILIPMGKAFIAMIPQLITGIIQNFPYGTMLPGRGGGLPSPSTRGGGSGGKQSGGNQPNSGKQAGGNQPGGGSRGSGSGGGSRGSGSGGGSGPRTHSPNPVTPTPPRTSTPSTPRVPGARPPVSPGGSSSPIYGPGGRPVPSQLPGTTPGRAPHIPRPGTGGSLSTTPVPTPKFNLKSLGKGWIVGVIAEMGVQYTLNAIDMAMVESDIRDYANSPISERKKKLRAAKKVMKIYKEKINNPWNIFSKGHNERIYNLFAIKVEAFERIDQSSGHQKGGTIGRITKEKAKAFKEARPGNGPLSEDTIAMGMPPLKRQRGGKVFLHWAASGYSGANSNYHATVQGDGSVSKTRDYNTFGGGHTWMQNSEGIGISLAAMAGASPDNFGSYPVKPIQYENMAKLVANILTDWGQGPSYVNDKNVPTHAEAGRDFRGPKGPYGPQPHWGDGNKWDLWMLYEGDPKGSGGPKIRGMIKSYMRGGKNDYDETSVEKGGTTNTNTGSMSRGQQRQVDGVIKQANDSFSMFSGLTQIGTNIGGPFGEFLRHATSSLGALFKGTEVAKKQKGGFVGNYKTAYHGLKQRFPEAKPHHVVGAMANFETEAPGIKPNTYQMGGGPGRGIAQWEVPHAGNPTGRWAKAEQMYGKGVINSLSQQLDFVKWEMNTGHPLPDGRPNLPWGRNAKREWLSSKTTAEATKNFLDGYEAPSKPHMDRRLANAKKFNSQAAVEESRKKGSGSTKAQAKTTTKPWWKFGFQNGGVVGMSENYHLNTLMEEFNDSPILVPVEIPREPSVDFNQSQPSVVRPTVGYSGGGANEFYRLSTGAAYS